MAKIYLAFYKHRRKIENIKTFGYAVFDFITRIATRGDYSHCEVAMLRDDGLYDCYSSSARDGGVRKKTMPLPPHKWDLMAVGCSKQQVVDFYHKTKGAKYDWLGALGLVLPLTQNHGRYFCSEWCFNAVFNSEDGWRFSPNQLKVL